MSGELRLREHDVTLRESDWDVLARWSGDPEVLYFADSEPVAAYALDEVQAIYRTVSQTALTFMIEHRGLPIGECWLQQMNLERITSRHPTLDLRRIDIALGEKQFWDRGLGTEAIGLLVAYAFEHEQADAVFACDVADYNPRSSRAFERLGFSEYAPTRSRRPARRPFFSILYPRATGARSVSSLWLQQQTAPAGGSASCRQPTRVAHASNACRFVSRSWGGRSPLCLAVSLCCLILSAKGGSPTAVRLRSTVASSSIGNGLSSPFSSQSNCVPNVWRLPSR